MNPYCTLPQLYMLHDMRPIGQLSNDKNQRFPDNDTAQFLLDVAASRVESYLGAWSPPIVNPPMVLTECVADMAVGLFYKRRANMPKELAARLEATLKWLESLASGSVTLPGVSRAIQPILGREQGCDNGLITRRCGDGSISDILR